MGWTGEAEGKRPGRKWWGGQVSLVGGLGQGQAVGLEGQVLQRWSR